jgi:hypothetical protein
VRNKRYLPLLAVLISACGHDDDRPLTAEFIVSTILAPTCGRAGCHSEATAWRGYAFDSLANARKAFQIVVVPGDADASLLYSTITGVGYAMPPEGPLPKADIALIRAWINGGAEGIVR